MSCSYHLLPELVKLEYKSLTPMALLNLLNVKYRSPLKDRCASELKPVASATAM